MISDKFYFFIEKILNESDKKNKDISYGYFLLANKVENKNIGQEMKFLFKGHDMFFNSDHFYRHACDYG